MTETTSDDARPLDGLRVIEMGQLLAGPFCGTLLGSFGAEVIKIEPPGGDPIRSWRVCDESGTSYWWYSLGRNKKCVTLDLRKQQGRDLARGLIGRADILIENFRPGTLEEWGLDPEELRAEHPELIVARISGYGQTGPYRHRGGYASVCEGFGGLRYVNGLPGERPVRANLSLGDSLAGIHATLGVLLSLLQRGRSQRGQVIDVGIFEAVYNLMEAVVPEYSGAGVVREPSGSTITGIVPTNTYRCADDRWVIIGGSGDSVFRRLMRTAGRDDLADDPRLQDNPGRVEHQREIDAAIEAWTSELPLDEVLDRLEAAEVPAGPIYSVREMFDDPQYRARGLFEEVETPAGELEIPQIQPKLGETPARTEWPGPALGAHNAEVFGELLGLDEAEREALRRAGVI